MSVGVQRKVDACTPNLLKNGLYCVMQDGELFNIMRSGLQPLSTTDGRFDTDIIQLATFGSTNFYTLSQQVV